MPIPLAIPAAISAGTSIASLISGSKKEKEAAEQREKAQSFFDANKYDIPESAMTALGVAKDLAGRTKLPGQDIIEERISATTGKGVQAAREVAQTPSDVLAVLTDLYGTEQERGRDLGIAGAESYIQNQRGFQDALNRMAGFEEQKWKYNVLYPYQQQMTGAAQLEGVGRTQMSQGIQGLGQTAAGLFSTMSAEQGYQEQISGFRDAFNPAVTAPQRNIDPVTGQPLQLPQIIG